MSGRPPLSGTRWFALSGRELAILALGVGIAVLAVSTARGLQWLWGRNGVTVIETGDLLPLPARLDVNTAEEHELALLPGIGSRTAAAIAAYRSEHGPFDTFEGLLAVRGIGPKTLERIRPYAMCAPVQPDKPPTGD